MAKSIYLAGKVRQGCWRHTIVKGLRKAFSGSEYEAKNIMPPEKQWPVLQKAVLGLDYTGPYFISCDHGCYHGSDTHGVGGSLDVYEATGGHGGSESENGIYRKDVVNWCLGAIDRSDIVFAWIEDKTAYGTIAELGYAKAKGKTIWIAGPEVENGDAYDMWSDLWFSLALANERLPYRDFPTPLAALRYLIPPQFGSPIEEKFWQVWMQMGSPFELVPQHPIGKYFVDFAYVPGQVAIELDGHATHSSPDAIAYDRKRQREIEASGWKVIRFGGKEIFTDAYKCAEEALTILKWSALKRKVDAGLVRIQQMQEKAKQSTQQPNVQSKDPATDKTSSLSMLTIGEVSERWTYINRRLRSRVDGARIAALVKEFYIVDIEDLHECPVVILRANSDFSYSALQQCPSWQEAIEWAMKIELKQECSIQLLETDAVACEECGMYMGLLEEEDIPICRSCWDNKMSNPRN